MKGIIFLIFLATVSFASTKDVIKDINLMHKEWVKNEIPCMKEIINIMESKGIRLPDIALLNATYMSTFRLDFNSPYHLDNYEECLRVPWVEQYDVKMKFCLAELKFKTSASKIKSITWGLCLPTVCSEESIAKYMKKLVDDQSEFSYDILINKDYCQVAGKEKEYGVDYYVIIFLQTTLFATVIISTLYINFYPKTNSQSCFTALAKSFDLKKNLHDFFAVTPNDLKVIHSMRFLSACILIYFHVFDFYLVPNLVKDADSSRHPWKLYQAFNYHTHVAVDTLFMFSGLLLAKSFLANVDRPVNIIKVIIKRYFRLMAGFVNVLMIYGLVLKYTVEGPLAPKWLLKETEICSNYSWRNMLMISNYYDTPNLCSSISWSIPVDFHLTIAGTLLFWLYQKNRRAGVMVFAVWSIASVILPGVSTYVNQLPHAPSFDFEFSSNFRSTLFLMPTYFSSHLRSGPYLVGIALAYLMTVYAPGKYRNVISKTLSITGSLLVLVVALAIFYILELLYHQPYDALQAAVVASLYRNVWALAIGLLVIICEYGNLPLVTSFLNWPIFVPLSRLSYGLYLYNNVVIIGEIMSIKNPQQLDVSYLVKRNFGITINCIIASFVQYLYAEAPINNFVGYVLNRRKPVQKVVASKMVPDAKKNNNKKSD